MDETLHPSVNELPEEEQTLGRREFLRRSVNAGKVVVAGEIAVALGNLSQEVRADEPPLSPVTPPANIESDTEAAERVPEERQSPLERFIALHEQFFPKMRDVVAEENAAAAKKERKAGEPMSHESRLKLLKEVAERLLAKNFANKEVPGLTEPTSEPMPVEISEEGIPPMPPTPEGNKRIPSEQEMKDWFMCVFHEISVQRKLLKPISELTGPGDPVDSDIIAFLVLERARKDGLSSVCLIRTPGAVYLGSKAHVRFIVPCSAVEKMGVTGSKAKQIADRELFVEFHSPDALVRAGKWIPKPEWERLGAFQPMSPAEAEDKATVNALRAVELQVLRGTYRGSTVNQDPKKLEELEAYCASIEQLLAQDTADDSKRKVHLLAESVYRANIHLRTHCIALVRTIDPANAGPALLEKRERYLGKAKDYAQRVCDLLAQYGEKFASRDTQDAAVLEALNAGETSINKDAIGKWHMWEREKPTKTQNADNANERTVPVRKK